MRLLECTIKDSREFEEFALSEELYGEDIPPYAILSHTWGRNGDEVTFKDLIDGTGKSKPGFKKIRFGGEQARLDGLRYIWLDTCCIDKSSSAELQEAINSMFRWYRDAAKCYVYLADVSFDANYMFFQPWDSPESTFPKSRWFTRGWTLQELIAPASVEFFSKEGNKLGDKSSLEEFIRDTTGICVEALRGSSLSEFSISERMMWAAKRKTKREEDKAYSLLGIFGVHMPLIYGEGTEHAFKRLEEEIGKASNGRSYSYACVVLEREIPFTERKLINGTGHKREVSISFPPEIEHVVAEGQQRLGTQLAKVNAPPRTWNTPSRLWNQTFQ
jgi:hypothetical protein